MTMTTELTMLGWTLVLAFVQILLFDVARTSQYGAKWNMGARDGTMPPLSAVAERLKRAQDNLFETLPLFIAAVLICRVVYVPLYAFGVPVLRSLVWIGSAVGLGMIVWAILAPV
jgi:uncharacterized MAPEG superfamily protein